jgi:hypothetical protein
MRGLSILPAGALGLMAIGLLGQALCAAGAPDDKPASTAGVGIALRKDGESLVVNALLPDGPAAASKAIHVGDRIIAVAQGDDGPDVPVQGWGIIKVVPLIRGPKGTTVRLTIVPANKDHREAFVVSLARGVLKELARWGDGELLKSGTKAPDIPLLPLGGKTQEKLSNYAGRIVVLEFWSISCRPCQRRMAELEIYPDQYPAWKDKVVLIGASQDDREDTVIQHVKAKRWDRTHIVRIPDEAMRAYHVNTLPTVYIIDQGGKVAASGISVDIPAIVNRLVHGKLSVSREGEPEDKRVSATSWTRASALFPTERNLPRVRSVRVRPRSGLGARFPRIRSPWIVASTGSSTDSLLLRCTSITRDSSGTSLARTASSASWVTFWRPASTSTPERGSRPRARPAFLRQHSRKTPGIDRPDAHGSRRAQKLTPFLVIAMTALLPGSPLFAPSM